MASLLYGAGLRLMDLFVVADKKIARRLVGDPSLTSNARTSVVD